MVARMISAVCVALLATCTSSVAWSDDEAAEILEQVIEKNRFWLDPQPSSLSYTLVGLPAEPKPHPQQMVNRVMISFDRVRWDLDSESDQRSANYTYDCTLAKAICLRAPNGVDRTRLPQVIDLRRFRQGIVWHTTLHSLMKTGVSRKSEIVKETTTDEGRVVEIETPLRNGDQEVGLGLYHVWYGHFQFSVRKARLHIRLPDLIPLYEEFIIGRGQPTYLVSYGPEFIKIGEHSAPSKLRFASSDQSSVIEANFHDVKGVWVLDRATNTHNGKRVAEIRLLEVSVDPIPYEKFKLPPETNESKPAKDDK